MSDLDPVDVSTPAPASTIPAPPVTPAPASPVEGATPEARAPKPDPSTPPLEGATEELTPDKPKQRASERIGEIYAQKKTAERQRDFALGELQRLRTQLATPAEREALDFGQQQQLDVREAVREERAEQMQEEARRQHSEAIQAQRQMFQTRVEGSLDRMPDFYTVFHDNVPVTNIAADFISGSDKGPEVAYYLGKNLAEARHIATLPAHLQGAELARIEARITQAPTVRKASTAPPPVSMIGGGTAPARLDPKDMNVGEMQAFLYGGKKG